MSEGQDKVRTSSDISIPMYLITSSVTESG